MRRLKDGEVDRSPLSRRRRGVELADAGLLARFVVEQATRSSEETMSQTARIIQFHVGRTGGTTLRTNVLFRLFDLRDVYFIGATLPGALHGTYDDLVRLPDETKARLRLIAGHMPFGIRDHLTDQHEWHYVTFVREPIARLVSAYFQIRSSVKHPRHHRVKDMSLVEFVQYDDGFQRNGTCRWLASTSFGQKFPSEQAMFDAALAHVEQFSFVGICELYDESVARLCRQFGWNVPQYGREYALTPKDHSLTQAERAALVDATQHDAKLYAILRKRFERQRSVRQRFVDTVAAWWKRTWLLGSPKSPLPH
jgi:hypothetical protein